MPFEIDDVSIRVIGYHQPIEFYDSARALQASIFLQTNDTLNIGGATVSGGGGVTSVGTHALDGPMHTGTLSNAQGPQFLLKDGTRDLEGNWLVQGACQIQFRDSDLAAWSSSDGYLDLKADTALQVTSPSTVLTGDLGFATGKGVTHADGVTAGYILQADGTRYVPADPAGVLPIAPNAQGDILLADATPEWTNLGIGAQYTHLESGGTTAAWQANLTLADDAWIGSGSAAGRLIFDTTPDPDQVQLSTANLHLGGNDLIVDADGDSYLHESADDVIDLVLAGASGELAVNINGAEDFTFTANSLNVLTGSYVTIADQAWVGLGAAAGRLLFDSTADPDQVEVTDADLYFATADRGIIHVDGNTSGYILQSDGTRYVPANPAGVLPIAPSAQGDMLLADATPAWTNLNVGAAAGYALVSTATTVEWDQTPTWSGLHTFGAGITFSGASGANDVTVPDNVAVAIELLDGGGAEYLRLVTTDAQPVILFNEAGADIDFHVESTGVADAFQVQGSDGQVTLGALGAGFVKADASGVLSNAAEVALAELADYAEGSLVIGGAADWETLSEPGAAGYALVSDGTTLAWDQTPSWSGLHTFAAGITFSGASGANNVTAPDNVAIAVELLDAGGLEYLRLVSTDAQPVILFNEAGADVDFHVEASGVADALQVQGSDGQITLGALGAGYVRSDASGVLSIGTIAEEVPVAPVAQGDMLLADATPAWSVLTLGGAAGYALVTTATTAEWDQTPAWSGLHTFGAGWVLSGGTGDLNGVDLIVDADGDSYLHESGDDVIDLVLAGASGEFGITINSAEDFTFTANALNVLAGSGVVMGNDTTLGQAAGPLLTFDDTNNYLEITGCKVGIGTATPTGNVEIYNSGANVSLRLLTNTSTTGFDLVAEVTTNDAYIINRDNADLIFRTNDTEAIRINSSQNLQLEGHDLLIDADNDSYLHASADDVVDLVLAGASGEFGITINSAEDFTFTANTFTVADGSSITSGDWQLDSTGGFNFLNGETGAYIRWRDSSFSGDILGYWRGDWAGGAEDDVVFWHVGQIPTGLSAGDAYVIMLAQDVDAGTSARVDVISDGEFEVTCGSDSFLNLNNAGQLSIGVDSGPISAANTTVGIVINQDANDDQIVAFKSSDVAHGATDFAESDVFGYFQKVTGDAGGLDIVGLRDADGDPWQALILRGILAENVDTTKSTAGMGIVSVHGFQSSGTSLANTVADGNVFSIRTHRGGSQVTVAIVDEDGDLHLDAGGGTGGTVPAFAFDEYDDGALLHGFRASLSPAGHELRERFGEFIGYARPVLEAAGVVHYNDGPGNDGRSFVSVRSLNYLLVDAVRQLYERCLSYERALNRLGAGLV